MAGAEEREETSVAGALAVAGRFGIKGQAAKSILREVFTAVAGWRRTTRRLRLKGATVEAYASAFEHELMDEARRLLAKQGKATHRRELARTLRLHSLASSAGRNHA